MIGRLIVLVALLGAAVLLSGCDEVDAAVNALRGGTKDSYSLHNATTKPVADIIDHGTKGGAQIVAQAATGNYAGAVQTGFDFLSWLFAGGAAATTTAATVLGVKLKKATRPYKAARDGERRQRGPRAPNAPPAVSAPTMAAVQAYAAPPGVTPAAAAVGDSWAAVRPIEVAKQAA